MADGAIGQNGASVQYHAVEQITPELGYVIVPLLHTGVLTVLGMHLKQEDATKTLVQVRNACTDISISKIMFLIATDLEKIFGIKALNLRFSL